MYYGNKSTAMSAVLKIQHTAKPSAVFVSKTPSAVIFIQLSVSGA